MSLLSYRTAQVEDLTTLAAFRWDMQLESHPGGSPPMSRETYIATYRAEMRAEMERDRMRAWIAEADGQPVACVGLIWWVATPGIEHPRRLRGHVTNVYTRPSHRRQGISRRLMELLMEHARAQGIQRLVLWSSDMGAPLYQSLGFLPSKGMEIDF